MTWIAKNWKRAIGVLAAAALAAAIAVALMPAFAAMGQQVGMGEGAPAYADTATAKLSYQQTQDVESIEVYVDGELFGTALASEKPSFNIPVGASVSMVFHYAEGYGAAFGNCYIVVRSPYADVDTQQEAVDGHSLRMSFIMPSSAAVYYANSVPVCAAAVADGIQGGALTLSASEQSYYEYFTVTAVPDEGYLLDTMSVSTDGGTTWTACTGIADNAYTTHGAYSDMLFTATFVPSSTEVIEIGTEEELRAFAAQVNAGTTFYKREVALTADIVLSGEWEPIGLYAGVEGSSDSIAHPFKGVFDGRGHTVSGLRVTGSFLSGLVPDDSKGAYVALGLFGYLDGATVKDLTVKGSVSFSLADAQDGVWITDGFFKASTFNCAGGVAGLMVGGALVEACVSYVDVSADAGILGGIAGHVEDGSVSGCRCYGQVNADETGALSATGLEGQLCGAGGVVGLLESGSVSRCGSYALVRFAVHAQHYDAAASMRAVVYSQGYAGGVVGYVGAGGQVSECCAKGGMDGSATYMGGVVGDACGPVTDCYSTSDVLSHAQDYTRGLYTIIGGAVGRVHNETSTYGEISVPDRVYATGNVSFDANPSYYRYGTVVGGVTSTGDDYSSATVMTAADCRSAYGTALYDAADDFSAADLGSAFKDDVNGVNGGYPLLSWEDSERDVTLRTVAFSVTDASSGAVLAAEAHVYTDEARTQEADSSGEGAWELEDGKYWYAIDCDGYLPVEGSFTVAARDLSVAVQMRAAAQLTFTIEPADAAFEISGSNIVPVSREGGSAIYLVADGFHYVYEATAPGRNGIMREIDVAGDAEVSVSLTESAWSAEGAISGNTVISQGGTYCLAADATGTITVVTSDPVTLVGTGTDSGAARKNLYINCTGQESHITLQDVYLYNTSAGNMIDFDNGQLENTLVFAGLCVCDYDGNAAGYAMFHVPDDAGLTVSCTQGDWSYIYKREQGAGFGGNGGASGGEGQEAETNGALTFDDARLFMKNSKQGALIGAGASAGTQEPGPISINNSELCLVAISRGAAIGGSAGSAGASAGSTVMVVDSTLTINIDYSGSAIGGGGHASGNDSDGGTLVPVRSSIRTYLDYNAIDPNGDGTDEDHSSDSLWAGCTEPGVNGNAAVTAAVQNVDGEALVLCEVDTTLAGAEPEDGRYLLEGADGGTLYNGPLHTWAYVNESLQKDEQQSINYTIDNWVPLSDSSLYVYLLPETQELKLNGTALVATWHAEGEGESGYFTVEAAAPSYEADEEIYAGAGDGAVHRVVYTADVAEGCVPSVCGRAMCLDDGAWTGLVTAAEYAALSASDFSIGEGQGAEIAHAGDVNGNGRANIVDAQVAYDLACGRYSGFGVIAMSGWLEADVNGDGWVTAADAFAIQRYVHAGEW